MRKTVINSLRGKQRFCSHVSKFKVRLAQIPRANLDCYSLGRTDMVKKKKAIDTGQELPKLRTIPSIPDLNDPRYLDEIGWFLYHEKYGCQYFGGSYDEERLSYSRMLLKEVLRYCSRDQKWLEDKTVVSIGCGCTCDLCTWPAAMKIAADPLLYVYQKLKMLVADVTSTRQTIYLSVSAENLPLLDGCADLILCRNALDHMPHPRQALKQMWRILKEDGMLFLSVDIGGLPGPDEPMVFSVESLLTLLRDQFEVLIQNSSQPHSKGRECSVQILARKKHRIGLTLEKERVLQAYITRHRRLGHQM